MDKSLGSKDEKALRIAYLIAGFLKQTLTPDEHAELDRWVEESDENMLLFEEMTDKENIEEGLKKMRAVDSRRPYATLQAKLPFLTEKKPRRLWPYAIAASLLLAVAGLYFAKSFLSKGDNTPGNATVTNGDIPPGTNKAILTLADGRKLDLKNQQSGALHSDSTVKIVKLDSGQIAYQGLLAQGTTMNYNTLTTPNGGQYRVTLSDGTKVWLNAASSLRFPVAFNGPERVVELNGEAYLEVAHDKTKPFYVRSRGQEIKVLGTRFNVNAYTEDEATKTTLVEGSIQLSVANKTTALKPGEEALVKTDGTVRVNANADVETVLAWKEGLFRFHNAPIQEIMKQVARWYDATIVYEGTVIDHFNGEIARGLPVSKVLALLAKTGKVHFQLTHDTITVQP